ncbi:MAG: hypothetical protein J0H29_05125 [Sphingobacteriales bacterium]|nr:hypothetical protein [Sphingobacteriales bacterium]OJY86194.1 MAG: hypothetical protein BGP14_17115 [Sphingobacteriales bacterium 44-15]
MSNQVQLQSVTSLQVTVNKKFPLSLIIEVTGEATTPGFTNIHLEPYFYIAPPEGGLYEFSLTGVVPDEEVNDKTGEKVNVTAEVYVWESFPSDLKGIKVYANENSAEELLFAEPAEAQGLF